jgi:hypothetical protein
MSVDTSARPRDTAISSPKRRTGTKELNIITPKPSISVRDEITIAASTVIPSAIEKTIAVAEQFPPQIH